jgi:hypothetical protein
VTRGQRGVPHYIVFLSVVGVAIAATIVSIIVWGGSVGQAVALIGGIVIFSVFVVHEAWERVHRRPDSE